MLEAEITLGREKVRDRFLLLTSDDVEQGKPAPDGLLKIAALRPEKKLLYVGDTVHDARCARAPNMPFIRIAPPPTPLRTKLPPLYHNQRPIQLPRNTHQIT